MIGVKIVKLSLSSMKYGTSREEPTLSDEEKVRLCMLRQRSGELRQLFSEACPLRWDLEPDASTVRLIVPHAPLTFKEFSQ